MHGADLIMLHVFGVPTAWDYPHTEDALEMEREAFEMSKKQMKALFDRYVKEADNLNVSFVAAENNAVGKGIVAAIKELNPDLVVVGTKGASKAREIIVGSTAKSLIRLSPCPVLSVPENTDLINVKKILYATDFLEDDIPAIRQLMALVQPFDPEIILAHVSTHTSYHSDERMQWFMELVNEKIIGNRIKFDLLLSDDILDSLNLYIKQNDIDLLAMVEKERSGVADRLFHNDHVKQMEFHTSVPLLSFNEHFLRVF